MARLKKGATDDEKRAAFLAALAASGNVTASAAAAGSSRRTLYNWRATDLAFAAAWAEAVELGVDALEDEVTRRAKEGVLRPVFQGGAKVGHVREFSDTLAMFLLKARRPEKFKDRVATELTGANGGPVRVQVYIPANGRDDPTP